MLSLHVSPSISLSSSLEENRRSRPAGANLSKINVTYGTLQTEGRGAPVGSIQTWTDSWCRELQRQRIPGELDAPVPLFTAAVELRANCGASLVRTLKGLLWP